MCVGLLDDALSIACNGRMTVNDELERIWQEWIVASSYLLGGTEKNQERTLDSRCPDR
jgi:hypothetical protein